MGLPWLLLVALLVVVISHLLRTLLYLTWRPYAVSKMMRAQGVQGPGYKFLRGSIPEMKSRANSAEGMVLDSNNHDYLPVIFPHFLHLKSQYGAPFLYWFGPDPQIFITNPDLLKQVLSKENDLYPKNPINPVVTAILGKGLVFINGVDWKRHRKVINPAFTMDKLKVMTTTMVDCTRSMVEGWCIKAIEDEGREMEVDIHRELQAMTADVISHTAFGSSYKEGKQVFLAQWKLQHLALEFLSSPKLSIFQYLPTRKNQQKWKLERKVRSMLKQIIQDRLADVKESDYGNDLLGMMLEACASEGGGKKGGMMLNMDEIVDECKTFFFAGHDTTSNLLTWTIFLLGTNQDWQEKLREEVLRECGRKAPNAEMLGKLKLVTMVLYETLRLYSPVPLIRRRAFKDMELGNLKIPKGTGVTIPIAMVHHDKELWGADADEFNPLRFENGASKAAKHPNALLAFSMGPRVCIGQNFAMLEAKTVIAMILQSFSISVSPKYVHAPEDSITLYPKYGLPVVLKALEV